MKNNSNEKNKSVKLGSKLSVIALGAALIIGGASYAFFSKEDESKEPSKKESVVKTEEQIQEELNESLPIAVTPEVGTPAPDFELEVLGDKEKKVSLSDFKGKKVVVHFFVSWCQFCQKQAPENEKFYQAIKDNEEVELVMVNLTVGEESIEAVNKHVSEHKLTSPILLDSNGEAAFEYNIQATPTNVFVNEDGTIANISEGALTKEEIEGILKGME